MRKTRCLFLSFALALVISTALGGGLASATAGSLSTTDLTTGLTAADLASDLAGPGVTVSNASYVGAPTAAGLFSGGSGIIDTFDTGVILSSGNIANVIGPNVSDDITADNGTPGDADLSALSGFATFDAAVLEFDFTADTTKVFFNYVFASDEYNEYVNTQFNDTFAFFVNGVNCALVGSDPVTINTINNGNPFNTDPRSHPDLYRNNDLQDGGGAINTEMDGLTVVLTCMADVNPNAPNHMKLAIADASDAVLDSNVFLERGSLTTTPPGGGGCADASPGPGGIRVESDAPIISGTPFNDVLIGGPSNNHIEGSSGNDCLDGGAGADEVKGGKGNDLIFGSDGNDRLCDFNPAEPRCLTPTGHPAHALAGGPGDDTISGGEGHDFLAGGDGTDHLDGGNPTTGDGKPHGTGDNCRGGAGPDTFAGCEVFRQ